jgi:hypothetical protein
MAQRRGTAAVLAIVAAVAAFFLHPVWGFFVALAGVVLGLVGFLRAASPTVSGGILSLVAIVLSLVALVVKIVEGALRLIF